MKKELIIGVFILGLIFCATHKTKDVIETFDTKQDCPNVLVREGGKLKLLNKNKAVIPGVNPVFFENLEEYVEFAEWQKAKGINCPVLYFQQTYNTQGDKGFRLLPDPIEKNAGLSSNRPKAQMQPLYDAGRDDKPYNENSYAGADPQDQNIGAYTPLDKLYNSSNKKSDNAMDTNWGGSKATRNNIKKGLYNDRFRPELQEGEVKGGQKKGKVDIRTKPITVSGHTINPPKTENNKTEWKKEKNMEQKQQLMNRSIQNKQLGLESVKRQ